MITGLVSQLHVYKNIHPNLARAIDHVLQLDFANLIAGQYEIEKENIFYMVNEYCTKPAVECEPERHRQYTDIQIMINGAEKFGYTSFINQRPSTEFLPDNDVAFYTIPAENIDYITLVPGKFILFFPTDIHQPEVCAGTTALVKKLIIKINMQ
jgi:YhcH/YjgK/YiaL family protein